MPAIPDEPHSDDKDHRKLEREFFRRGDELADVPVEPRETFADLEPEVRPSAWPPRFSLLLIGALLAVAAVAALFAR